jgi:ribosomal protein S15P/S13E
MKNNCFDEGIIQAFFDGELKAGLLEQVARHISDCEPCAMLMSNIEAESAAVSMAFERENFELVPTERLRAKIFTEIAELENGRASWLKKAAAALGFSNGFKWTSPAVAAFASLVFVVGVVGFVLMSKPEAPPAIAGIQSKSVINKTAVAPSVVPDDSVQGTQDEPVSNPIVRQASYVPARAVYRETVSAPVVKVEVQPLQDEQRYLQTIDTLKRSVDDRKDNMLKPSNLVSYERDMAIVDDAIKKMQKAARKNPKDEASKQLLLASYQNKIDLLSAVSEKTELMVSMR